MEPNHQLNNVSDISDDEREEALIKYRIIQPFLQNIKTITIICEEQQLSRRTISRWIANYRKDGSIGLSPAKRHDTGKFRSCSSYVQQLIEGIYLQNQHLSRASIYRKVKSTTSELNTACPSYRTICSIIAKIPEDMVVLAHQATKQYKQQFDLLCNHQAKHSNELWQADHMLLDILILSETAKEKAIRPWLTIIIDDYSRAIAGYELSFLAPSAMKTALALRQAIWRKKEPQWSICGIPNILYTDHGSDFTSKHIEQVCVDLKIQLIFSAIGEPRGRGKIERFFRTLNQLLISELPGYVNSKNPLAKYTLAELNAMIQRFIVEYNQRLHPSVKEAPKARWEMEGFLPNMPDSIDQLDLLLLTVTKSRLIQRDGIRFQGLRYLDPVLADYVGESVIIRYDPTDITSIRVFYKNSYLCQPICQALDGESVNLKEIQAARAARRKSLQKEINQRISLVDAILIKKESSIMRNSEEPLKKKSLKLKLYENDE